jgi:hypothetical protein
MPFRGRQVLAQRAAPHGFPVQLGNETIKLSMRLVRG